MSGRRKVLLVIKNLQQGGTERQVLRLLQSLDAGRFDARLCTLSPELHYRDELPDGEPSWSLGCGMGLPAIGAIARVIDEFQPDLVHTFRDRVNLATRFALARSRHQPAWLMSVRGRPISPGTLALAPWLAQRAQAVTVNSVGIASTLCARAGVPDSRIALTPNLLPDPIPARITQRARAEARARLGLAPEAFVWALPARIAWVKNQHGLARALARLARRGRLPDGAVVLLAGRVRDQAYGRLLPRFARWLGVEDRLRMLGPVDDPTDVYAAADALVLPSWAEGMPNVSLEAQLAGLPAVVSHEANRDEIVDDGATGFEVPNGGIGALADAMDRMMRFPAVIRSEMGARGRERLLARYDARRLVARVEGLYDRAIAAERAGVRLGAPTPWWRRLAGSEATSPLSLTLASPRGERGPEDALDDATAGLASPSPLPRPARAGRGTG